MCQFSSLANYPTALNTKSGLLIFSIYMITGETQTRDRSRETKRQKGTGAGELGTLLSLAFLTHLNRELKQQRRRRLQKLHLKSEFAPLQTLSRSFHLVYFVKCWQMFLELNSKEVYRSSGKEKKVVVLCSHPRQNVNSGIFTL